MVLPLLKKVLRPTLTHLTLSQVAMDLCTFAATLQELQLLVSLCVYDAFLIDESEWTVDYTPIELPHLALICITTNRSPWYLDLWQIPFSTIPADTTVRLVAGFDAGDIPVNYIPSWDLMEALGTHVTGKRPDGVFKPRCVSISSGDALTVRLWDTPQFLSALVDTSPAFDDRRWEEPQGLPKVFLSFSYDQHRHGAEQAAMLLDYLNLSEAKLLHVEIEELNTHWLEGLVPQIPLETLVIRIDGKDAKRSSPLPNMNTLCVPHLKSLHLGDYADARHFLALEGLSNFLGALQSQKASGLGWLESLTIHVLRDDGAKELYDYLERAQVAQKIKVEVGCY